MDSDPLYRPPTPADGRWQRGTVIEGLYLAAEEATVWAEWYRWLAEHEIEPLHSLPRELWRYRISLRNVADLTGNGALAELGLPDAIPGREQWPAFQRVGERLQTEDSTVSCIARRRDHKACACASFAPSPQTSIPGWSRLRLPAGLSGLPRHLAACARRSHHRSRFEVSRKACVEVLAGGSCLKRRRCGFVTRTRGEPRDDNRMERWEGTPITVAVWDEPRSTLEIVTSAGG